MFEFTKSKDTKKKRLEIKGKYLDTKSLLSTSFIRRIIQRFSYFDILILLVVFAVLGFLLYNRLQRKSQWINIRISVENVDWWYRGSPPENWYATDLKPGDTAQDSFGNEAAEVVRVENYDSGGPYRNIYVDLKLKVDFDKKRNQYLYEYKPVAVGSSETFNFSRQQVQGLVVNVGDKAIEYNYHTIRVRKKIVTPEYADKIKIGDKSFDNNNNLTAEVLDIKDEISSSFQFSDIRGANIKTYNPAFRDLELTLKVRTYSQLGLDFFINNAVLKTGAKIWVQFPGYALEDCEIIEIVN